MTDKHFIIIVAILLPTGVLLQIEPLDKKKNPADLEQFQTCEKQF